MVRIQTDFMQSLMNAAGEQTRSLAEAYTKTASNVAKKPLSAFRNKFSRGAITRCSALQQPEERDGPHSQERLADWEL
jgi:hypothetical protein